MKLSRNKIDKIFKIRNQTKKKNGKKKKRKGGRKRKRSFRENKLNLKKNTLRFKMKSQKGGNPLDLARYAVEYIIKKILHIQLLILIWRNTYLSGMDCYIITYSTNPDSIYMKLFGDFITSNVLDEKVDDIKLEYKKANEEVKGLFVEKAGSIWSILHHYACQINGYFVIPTTDINQQSTILTDLQEEEGSIIGNEVIFPGKSMIHSEKTNTTFWTNEENNECKNFKNLCEYIITPTKETISSVSMWLLNTWGLKYGGNVPINCTEKEKEDSKIKCPRQSRLSNNNTGSYLTMQKIKKWGKLIALMSTSLIECSEPVKFNSNLTSTNTKSATKTAEQAVKQNSEIFKANSENTLTEMKNFIDTICLSKEKKNNMRIGENEIKKIKNLCALKLQNCAWDGKGGRSMDLIYLTIMNSYIRAPTDRMLNYWWQKETLLFLPLKEGTDLEVKTEDSYLNTYDRYIESVGRNFIENIPTPVNQLIIRRVLGIMIRTNMFGKDALKRKDVGDEQWKKEKKEKLKKSIEIRNRLIKEGQLNYVRAQFSKNFLLKRMEKCNKEFQILSNRSKTDINLGAENVTEAVRKIKEEMYNPKIIDGNKEFEFKNSNTDVFGTKFGNIRRRQFTIEEDGDKYKYNPITAEKWIKINILSLHQLILECWAMSLDSSTYRGEQTKDYRVPSILLNRNNTLPITEAQEILKRVANGEKGNKEFLEGQEVYYINKITEIKQDSQKKQKINRIVKFAKCTIIKVNQEENGGRTYDIQFVENIGIDSNPDYIPRQSPLWMKFRLLIQYLITAVPHMQPNFRMLFETWDDLNSLSEKYEKIRDNRSANLLKILGNYKALSNGESVSLKLDEMRTRLCKLWLVFSAMLGWCNYDKLFEDARGVPDEKKMYILAKKTGLLASKTGSVGWAEVVNLDNSLKLKWIDRWVENQNTTTNNRMCNRAPTSGPPCWEKQKKAPSYWDLAQPNIAKVKAEFGESSNSNVQRSLYNGGNKCDITQLLKRIQIPVKETDLALSEKDQMKSFAKNFKIRDLMLNPEECPACEDSKQCEIPLSKTTSNIKIICRPLAVTYKSVGKLVNEIRERKNETECQNLQKDLNDQLNQAVDPKDESRRDVFGNKFKELSNSKKLKKSLRNAKSRGKTIAEKIAEKIAVGAKITGKKMLELAKKKNINKKLLRAYNPFLTKKYKCDAECQKRIANQQNITFIIKSTPDIPPGYIIEIIQSQTGQSDRQAVAVTATAAAAATAATVTATDAEDPVIPAYSPTEYSPPVGEVVIEGEIV